MCLLDGSVIDMNKCWRWWHMYWCKRWRWWHVLVVVLYGSVGYLMNKLAKGSHID